MLPERHHPHDRAWIVSRLMLIDAEQRGRIAELYSVEYAAAHDAEQVEQRKDGAARMAANTRLRKFTENLALLR